MGYGSHESEPACCRSEAQPKRNFQWSKSDFLGVQLTQSHWGADSGETFRWVGIGASRRKPAAGRRPGHWHWHSLAGWSTATNDMEMLFALHRAWYRDWSDVLSVMTPRNMCMVTLTFRERRILIAAWQWFMIGYCEGHSHQPVGLTAASHSHWLWLLRQSWTSIRIDSCGGHSDLQSIGCGPSRDRRAALFWFHQWLQPTSFQVNGKIWWVV